MEKIEQISLIRCLRQHPIKEINTQRIRYGLINPNKHKRQDIQFKT